MAENRFAPDPVDISPKVLKDIVKTLHKYMKPFLKYFHRPELVETAEEFLQGLMYPGTRKSAEPLAYIFHKDRKVFQRFVGSSPWSDEDIRTEATTEIAEVIGQDDGVIILDPSAFKKQGKCSVGVKRQWCGRLGKVENCQLGVFLSYASAKGRSLVDAQLFLPKELILDSKAREIARIPEDRIYLPAWEIADELLEARSKMLPHACVLGDSELGRCSEWRDRLAQREEWYELEIPSNLEMVLCGERGGIQSESQKVSEWFKGLSKTEWTRIQTRVGSKGPMVFNVAMARVRTKRGDIWGRPETLLAIHPLEQPEEISFLLVNMPKGTSLETMVQYATRRWYIENCFERAKGEVGLAQYEVRSWVGWHHHMTMGMLASWFIEKMRVQGGESFSPSDIFAVSHDHSPPIKISGNASRKNRMDGFKNRNQKPGRRILSFSPKTETLSNN